MPIQKVTIQELAAICVASRFSPFDTGAHVWALRRHAASGELIADPSSFVGELVDAMFTIIDDAARTFGSAYPVGRQPATGCYSPGCDRLRFACRSGDFGDGVRVVHTAEGWQVAGDARAHGTREAAERAAQKAVVMRRVAALMTAPAATLNGSSAARSRPNTSGRRREER
jgi:hypothetical protein